MTTPLVDSDLVANYLELAVAGDIAQARRLVMGWLDRGVPFAEVVGLLAAAQHEAGRRWQSAQWSVADEHLVSGVTQRCLDVVSSIPETRQSTAHVLMACAEGDWHSLPSQMFGELLRARGLHVTDLGASTPAVHVAQYLDRRHADALVITCSIPLHFAGVTKLAAVAHARGVPVLAGGRALAAHPQRAIALGADAWADDVDTAVETIHAWRQGVKTPALHDVTLNPDAMRLQAAAGDVAAEALSTLQELHPTMRDFNPDQRARTLEDLSFITEFVAAARLLDDASIVEDFVVWLTAVLQRRGVPVASVRASAEALTPIIAQIDPESARLLSESLAPASTRDG